MFRLKAQRVESKTILPPPISDSNLACSGLFAIVFSYMSSIQLSISDSLKKHCLSAPDEEKQDAVD